MKSPRLTLMLASLLLATAIHAQDDVATAQEVNEQLWKPFKASFEARDWETYNALHTEDVLRVNKWGIKLGEEYRETIKNHYSQEDNRTRSFDLWLEQRLYRDDIGYEVGYYHITSQAPGEEMKSYFGRFHVRLRKENGRWKIAQDWDTDQVNGVPLTAEDFAKGTPLKF